MLPKTEMVVVALSTNSGLEKFAAAEAEQKLGATGIETTQSFVRFNTAVEQCDPSTLLKLRLVLVSFSEKKKKKGGHLLHPFSPSPPSPSLSPFPFLSLSLHLLSSFPHPPSPRRLPSHPLFSFDRVTEHVYAGIAVLDESVTSHFKEKAGTECMDLIARSITPKAFRAALHIWKQAAGAHVRDTPTFRVNCRRIGGRSKHMRSTDIAAHVGVHLRQSIDDAHVRLTNNDFQVYIRVEDTFVFVGIPLNQERLTDRANLVVEGLRGSAACAMAMLLDPQPGQLVVDPMCGKGALLLEAYELCPQAVFLGSDMSNSQLRAAAQNALGTKCTTAAFLKGDARALPIDAACVDGILCDLPFGQKFGSKRENAALYPLVLAECQRILRPAGKAVFLTSRKQLATLMAAINAQPLCWSHNQQQEQYKLKLGNTDSVMVLVDSHAWRAVLEVPRRCSLPSFLSHSFKFNYDFFIN